MGSSLDPVLANLFMVFRQKRWLDQFEFCDGLLGPRYNNDVISLFNSKEERGEFFNFLNSQHSNIKFTFEIQKDHKLGFTDALISQANQNFCTSVCHKITAIGLYTNFISFMPHSYKIGSIKTLIHRTYEISNSWTSFNEEISNIKHIFIKICILVI